MSTTPYTDLVIIVTVPYRPDQVSTVRAYDNSGYNNFTGGGVNGTPIDADSIDRFVDMFDVNGVVARAIKAKRSENRKAIVDRIKQLEENVKELDQLRQRLREILD